MLLNIDQTDVKNHRSIADVDLGFAVKYELQVLKKVGRVTKSNLQIQKRCAISINIMLSCLHL